MNVDRGEFKYMLYKYSNLVIYERYFNANQPHLQSKFKLVIILSIIRYVKKCLSAFLTTHVNIAGVFFFNRMLIMNKICINRIELIYHLNIRGNFLKACYQENKNILIDTFRIIMFDF